MFTYSDETQLIRKIKEGEIKIFSALSVDCEDYEKYKNGELVEEYKQAISNNERKLENFHPLNDEEQDFKKKFEDEYERQRLDNEHRLAEMQIVELLEYLGYDTQKRGTYSFAKVLRQVSETIRSGNELSISTLKQQLANPYSNIYLVSSDYDGIVSFHAAVLKEHNSVLKNTGESNTELVEEIFGCDPKKEVPKITYSEGAFKIGEYVANNFTNQITTNREKLNNKKVLKVISSV